jgi:hypothetical protein
MGVKHIIQLESDTAVSERIEIPFEFKNLQSLPEGKETSDKITVSPLTVRAWFQLKPLLASIEKADLTALAATNTVGFDAETEKLMEKYDETIFEIICIGIHNKKGKMPDWFREVLKDNSTWQDLYILLNAILFRIGCNPFLNSITALRVVSPLSEEEIIALQRNKESWSHKVASCSSASSMKPSDTATNKP